MASLTARAREGLREAYLAAHAGQGAADEECRRCSGRLAAAVRRSRPRRDVPLERHLERCARCRRAALELNDLNQRLRTVLPVAVLLFGAPAYLDARTAAGAGHRRVRAGPGMPRAVGRPARRPPCSRWGRWPCCSADGRCGPVARSRRSGRPLLRPPPPPPLRRGADALRLEPVAFRRPDPVPAAGDRRRAEAVAARAAGPGRTQHPAVRLHRCLSGDSGRQRAVRDAARGGRLRRRAHQRWCCWSPSGTTGRVPRCATRRPGCA
ncbi:hypothetical protein NKH18_32485 [Streptomyces sp. M10(2022)]